ncbi:MAG: electron transfer flavoprotein subunit alpha/FixB family protein, partial [Calditrichaeota bacterium]|nr:electron transfer flavoprotein subunit alpha/FixB family protein [Calditrichota bacterium]
GSLASGLDGFGIDRLLAAMQPELSGYSPEGYGAVVEAASKALGAEVILFPATSMGRDLAPTLAARLDAAFLPDCTELTVTGGRIAVRRPVYAGRLMITLEARTLPAIVSLRPKAFLAIKSGGSAPALESLSVDLTGVVKTVCVETRQEGAGKLDVSEADVIVSGGRGMKGPENFHLVEDLAAALDGAVGASRAVVDAGWRPHGEQVGQTGKVVGPSLYIACGISGAIQHLAGMRSSKVIVAINKDSDAPIFKAADYGIVGDVFEVLPALTAAVKALAR